MKPFELFKQLLAEEASAQAPPDDLVRSGRSR
jgi:hypothetical protein